MRYAAGKPLRRIWPRSCSTTLRTGMKPSDQLLVSTAMTHPAFWHCGVSFRRCSGICFPSRCLRHARPRTKVSQAPLGILDFSPAKLLEFFLRQRCTMATCSHCLHHSGHCFIQETFAFCQVDDVSDSQTRILGSAVFWMYVLTGLSECVQVICYRYLSGRLDLQEVPRNQQYGDVSHTLTHIAVALGPQLVFILSVSHGFVKQHVLNHGRKKRLTSSCTTEMFKFHVRSQSFGFVAQTIFLFLRLATL